MTRPRRILVTFATPDFTESLDRLVDSAYSSGQFEDVYIWNETLLRRDPLFRGKALLAYDRGVGFWSWKPHIILDALTHARDGDVVVYSDAGRYRGGYTVYRSVAPLVDSAERNDGFFTRRSHSKLRPDFALDSPRLLRLDDLRLRALLESSAGTSDVLGLDQDQTVAPIPPRVADVLHGHSHYRGRAEHLWSPEPSGFWRPSP